RSLGIALVHQELSLLPELTVAENIFLGREPYGRLPGFISRRAAERPAAALLAGLGIGLSPAAKVERLSIAERQLVEIAKGVSLDPRVLILDEPTSSLTYQETHELFRVVSFTVRSGEIVGLYGLIGSGRTSLAEALFGLAPADAGEIRVDGRPVAVRSPGRALGHGIAMAPEDRRARGLVPMLSVRTNLSLSALAGLSRLGFVDHGRERRQVARLIDGLMIRASSPAQEVADLSGGNQQKVV